MRDFKVQSRSERVEPSIGSSPQNRVEPEFDDPLFAPKPSRRREVERPTNNTRDVLMDDETPAAARLERNVRPVRAKRREQGFQRVSPRVDAHQSSRDWSVSFGWLRPAHFALLIVSGLLIGLYWASEPIAQFLERPFKSVVVEGDFRYVSKNRATDLISQEIDSNFLKLDLMRIKRALSDDPWVDSVNLQRRWPDTLVVKIIEQKPIARWGNGFLNQRGEIVLVEQMEDLSGLPWLQGSEANAIEILQQYLDVSQVLRTRGLDVIALKCDDKKSWRLTLNNDVEIVIGRDEVMEKVHRFADVYDGYLNTLWTDIASIDARYSNGVAIRWKENSVSAAKFLKAVSTTGNK